MSVILVYDPEVWAPPPGLRIEGQAVTRDATEDSLGEIVAGHDVIVGGDDRLLGRLVTGLTVRHQGSLTRFAPLRVGEFSELGMSNDVKHVLAALQNRQAKETTISSLRIVSSAQPRATYGFQLGVGAVARIAEQWRRHGRSSGTARFVVNEARQPETDAVQFRVNHGSMEEGAYLQVCAIEHGWLKMTASDRPTLRFGQTAADLLKDVPSRRLKSLTRRVTGRDDAFEVVHITAHNGYVVDGDVSADSSGVVQVSVGPRVRLLKV